jgi:hypothetical protein
MQEPKTKEQLSRQYEELMAQAEAVEQKMTRGAMYDEDAAYAVSMTQCEEQDPHMLQQNVKQLATRLLKSVQTAAAIDGVEIEAIVNGDAQ